jgi:preprotein translocase subunit YajC
MTQMLTVFLMASPDGGQPNSSFSLIMMGAIILVFWLFMIRPQAKKSKDQKKYI